MDNKENFSPEEQKAINKYSWLKTLFILINGIMLAYVNNAVKQGTYHLYLVTVLLIATTVITIMILITYFQKNRHITKYKSIYLASSVLMIFLFILHVFICKDYVMDIFAGERTIITSEYSVLWGYFHTEIDGEEIHLNLPDETIKKLHDNEYIDSEEIYNFNTGTYYYKKKAHIIYYPNSKILKDAFIED
ncbi:MAG: hypothetical protein K2J08_00445 [Ruminococcus sp.]|nr:hypothetical protein [Ruminococcus sp.]